MNIMRLYYRLPVFAQNIATTIQGLVFKKERYGDTYRNALEEYKRRDYSNKAALEDYQWERIGELIHFAVEHSSFYKEFYKNIDIEKAISNRDITLLPVLEKEIVRNHVEEMYCLPPDKGKYGNTSGTTGSTIKFMYDVDDQQRRMAYLDAFKMYHGYIPMKMKRASFTSAKVIPSPPKQNIYWRDNWAINQRLYSGYHCKGKLTKYYVENLMKYKPESLDGYPSAMFELAQYINQNNIDLGFTPIAIFPTAETLLPHYRAEIESAFKCPVRDQYASSEGSPFIVECKCGKLHVAMDTGLIEFLDDGRMLVTCFETHGTPLIRYDIKDMAYLADDQTCECGWNMPVVERIEGRTIDYIISPKYGRITSVYLSLVSGDFMNSVRAMQFVQNDLYSIDVYLVFPLLCLRRFWKLKHSSMQENIS